MTETALLQSIRRALAETGLVMLYRNSVGYDAERKIKYGFGKGSPDLCGVLRPSGRFVGFEVKTPAGRLSTDQSMWHQACRLAGGFVAVVRSPNEALAALTRAQTSAVE
jgi:hypothetical protein